jgi:hypothetical protein
MGFSGILRHVALVKTDFSEELSASIIRVTRIGELGKKLAVVPSSPILDTLMMEALSSSETSVLTRTTRRNILEDTILHGHRSRKHSSQNSPLVLNLTHINPVHTTPLHSFFLISISILRTHLLLGLHSELLLLVFEAVTYNHSSLLIYSTCPAHLIRLNLIS